MKKRLEQIMLRRRDARSARDRRIRATRKRMGETTKTAPVIRPGQREVLYGTKDVLRKTGKGAAVRLRLTRHKRCRVLLENMAAPATAEGAIEGGPSAAPTKRWAGRSYPCPGSKAKPVAGAPIELKVKKRRGGSHVTTLTTDGQGYVNGLVPYLELARNWARSCKRIGLVYVFVRAKPTPRRRQGMTQEGEQIRHFPSRRQIVWRYKGSRRRRYRPGYRRRGLASKMKPLARPARQRHSNRLMNSIAGYIHTCKMMDYQRWQRGKRRRLAHHKRARLRVVKRRMRTRHLTEKTLLGKPGSYPLIYAAWTGDLERVKALIASKSDLNRHISNWSALRFALYRGHDEVALALIDAGARIRITTGGKTLDTLEQARRYRRRRVVTHLTQAGTIKKWLLEP